MDDNCGESVESMGMASTPLVLALFYSSIPTSFVHLKNVFSFLYAFAICPCVASNNSYLVNPYIIASAD